MTKKNSTNAISTDAKPIVNLSSIRKDERGEVESLLEELSKAFDCYQRAANRWIGLSDATRAKIRAATPNMDSLWDRLDLVGEGRLHPHLVAAPGNTAKLLRKLTVEEQEYYLKNRFEVAIPGGDKKMVDLASMSGWKEQVFEVDKKTNEVHVRSVPEQRAWLKQKQEAEEARAAKLAEMTKIDRPGKWAIKGKKGFLDYDFALRWAEKGATVKEVEAFLKDLKAV